MTRARAWHLLTALVATGAVLFQLVLVVRGGVVLDEQDPPGLVTRLCRFAAYFTIQSNVLVALGAWWLTRDPEHDGERWRMLRVASISAITVTGIVHFVLLRPLLDLHGADYAADKLLHMVVPALAVVGWLVLGPRPRVDGPALTVSLAFPVLWLAVTLAVGAASGWYPYPFLDHREDGAAAVVVSCVGVTVLFVVLLLGIRYLDRRLPPTADSSRDS